MDERVIESVANFGPRSALLGILTEPAESANSNVAVVILNAGVIHRPGPNRVSVDLARAIARGAGLPVLRMDMAGIGDSDGLGASSSQDEECLLSIEAALDFLELRGSGRRFILVGACSGATYALQYASRDERVVGVVGSDPPTLARSKKYYVLRVLDAARRPAAWYRLMTGRYHLLRWISRGFGRRQPRDPHPWPDGPTPQEWRATFAEMARREVWLLLIITGWGTRVYNYQGQLFDLFPGMGLERTSKIVLLPGAEHTFTFEADRTSLKAEVLEWVRQSILSRPWQRPDDRRGPGSDARS